MSITEFGKVVRQFRDKENVSLRQMADKIGRSPTYISAVEVGEKSISDDLIEKVVGFFRKRGMKTKDLTELRVAVDRTRRTVNVGPLDDTGRLAVAVFARKWDDLDKQSRERFLRQLDISSGDDNR